LCPPVIVLAADGSIEHAVRAIKLGAYDYLLKPADLTRLKLIARSSIEKYRLKHQSRELRYSSGSEGLQAILGASPAIRRIRELIVDVAATDAKVLILGESGTGKELVARAIHAQSRRSEKIFAPVNMAALPPSLAESVLFGHEKGAFTGADTVQKGWCEMADQGTLFLDEIGEMDMALQAKILRFLQDSTFHRVGSNKVQLVDVRIIAATNRNPEALLREGRLREDLYYRLNVLPITMPPLRERGEDILLLAHVLLDRAAKTHRKPITGFADSVLEIFAHYDWPGNVRQLQNVVERMVILSHNTTLTTADVPADILPSLTLSQGSEPIATLRQHSGDGRYEIRQIEKEAILRALSQTQWNVVQAARILGLGQATVYRKMKRYGIHLKRGSDRNNNERSDTLPRIVAS
jgi:DNA-binding NtrC family response regulator